MGFRNVVNDVKQAVVKRLVSGKENVVQIRRWKESSSSGAGVLPICEHDCQSGCGNSKAMVDHAEVTKETKSDQKVCCGSVGSHET